jgi:hypothetical protein
MKLRPDFFSRKNIIRVIGTLLSIALLIYLLSQQGWNEIVNALRQIPPINLVLVVILMAISRISVGALVFPSSVYNIEYIVCGKSADDVRRSVRREFPSDDHWWRCRSFSGNITAH